MKKAYCLWLQVFAYQLAWFPRFENHYSRVRHRRKRDWIPVETAGRDLRFESPVAGRSFLMMAVAMCHSAEVAKCIHGIPHRLVF